MSNYDFSTLNPTDFEKLVCDLLNKHAKGNSHAQYRTSKEGKDRGIDLLFSTAQNDFEIVVQVKHYVKSTFSKLKSDLIKKEVDKVKKINPKQYIFVTSLGLSVENKKQIKEIFSPYISSLQDVLGNDDINNLLSLHKDVEEKHFKLWFSSTIALEKLINYRFVGRNDEFSETEVKRKLRLFVSTRELEKAKWILDHNKFLIITGEPGVGKTTLSEVLIYKYLSNDFELTYIYNDIKDIESKLKNDDSKQIFYFDDFLGHTQAEISKSKSAEAFLLKIISRIEKSENKFLILNTRKFILSTFLEESERFRNFNPLRAENKIELLAYSFGAKRRMLDNHIFECQLEEKQIEVLKELSFFICTHKNFTPRHIDFYTSSLHVGQFTPSHLKSFIIDNLINPKKIWEHAYSHQISDYEKFFLNTLYSLNGTTNILLLENAYNNRLNYEVKYNNFNKPLNSFKECLQKLNGGFIEISTNRNFQEVRFINPSLEDFIHYWLEDNNSEIERILFSAINLEQWYYFFRPYSNTKFKITNSLITFLTSNYLTVLDKKDYDEELYKAAILIFHFNLDDTFELVASILKKIGNWDFIIQDSKTNSYALKFLQAAKSKKQLNQVISNFKLDFFVNLLLSMNHLDELIELINLFEKHYAFNFKNTFRDREDDFKFNGKVKKVKKRCKKLIQDQIDIQYNCLLDNKEIDAHLDIVESIKEYKNFMKTFMFPKFKVNYSILTEMDWNSRIEINAADQIVFGTAQVFNENDETYSYEYDEYEEYYESEKNIIPVSHFFEGFIYDLPF